MSETGLQPRRFALPFVVGIVLALCGGGGLLAIVAVDPIVTSQARAALAERGVVCDERFAVDVGIGLSSASIAPTSCRLERSRHAHTIELPEGATVTLSGLAPSDVRAAVVRVELGAEAPAAVDLGPMGPLGTLASLGERVGATARAAAELAAHRPPPTTVERLELRRDGEEQVVLEQVVLGGGEPMELHVAGAELAALSGPLGITARGELRNVTGTATSSTSHLEGDLVLSARLPVVGELRHATHLVLDGAALDGEHPELSVSTR